MSEVVIVSLLLLAAGGVMVSIANRVLKISDLPFWRHVVGLFLIWGALDIQRIGIEGFKALYHLM